MDVKRTLLPVSLLALIAAMAGTAASMLQASAFERFLGPLHPALAVGIAVLIGLPALLWLAGPSGYALVVAGDSRRGLVRAAGFAGVFALGVIAADLAFRYPAAINVPLPHAFLVYPVMALIVELLFHVAFLTLVLLLLRPLTAKVGQGRVFWAAIAAVALAEPILQVVWAGTLSWTELYTAVSIFLFGVVQLALFRRYGFVSMLSMRLVFYLLWHITWGHLRLDLLF